VHGERKKIVSITVRSTLTLFRKNSPELTLIFEVWFPFTGSYGDGSAWLSSEKAKKLARLRRIRAELAPSLSGQRQKAGHPWI
jgi:hypothetical protein